MSRSRVTGVRVVVASILMITVVAAILSGGPAQAPAPKARPESSFSRKLEKVKARIKNGRVLFEDKFDRDDISDAWIAEQGEWRSARAAKMKRDGVVGVNGSKYPDSFLWTKRSFKGDIVVEFDAECLSDPANDINFVICGKSPNYPPPEVPLYLFGLGGWGNSMSGVERAPKYRWKALTGLFTIQPRRKYHVVAARFSSKFYLFVDGKLIVHARDPKPIKAEGQFAFHVYNSKVLYSNLQIRSAGK